MTAEKNGKHDKRPERGKKEKLEKEGSGVGQSQ